MGKVWDSLVLKFYKHKADIEKARADLHQGRNEVVSESLSVEADIDAAAQEVVANAPNNLADHLDAAINDKSDFGDQ